MSTLDSQASSVEKAVIDIVSDVLRLPQISREDNLLALGVDSLVGTRIAVKLQARFDVDVTLQDIFENPQLSDFVDLMVEFIGEQSAK